MPPFWITTSWDDGHPLDLRIAELLNEFGLTGTFYIARDYLPERLSDAQIAALSKRHEIGAHTLTHPMLDRIPAAAAYQEISGSRDWLQQVTGKPIDSFCYPRGAYNAAVRQQVADAGYTIARTVAPYVLCPTDDPLTMPTTLQVYPFPLRPIASVRARFERLWQIRPYLSELQVPLFALRSWPALAIALLERASAVGGVWHLWGHSWEIEQYSMWDDLRMVLAAAAQHPDGQAVTNLQFYTSEQYER